MPMLRFKPFVVFAALIASAYAWQVQFYIVPDVGPGDPIFFGGGTTMSGGASDVGTCFEGPPFGSGVMSFAVSRIPRPNMSHFSCTTVGCQSFVGVVTEPYPVGCHNGEVCVIKSGRRIRQKHFMCFLHKETRLCNRYPILMTNK
ncbi:hypothetical protein DFH08DRAFT_802524 [Mycena albidolilacea]|uniref:Uncharacterized protein n=1 Tax=Mycena albidolilacea TaxID=1033008 RepID=A0AAD7AE78_9AGAR|nr:hypothetical protein DFH08DRAFT_802524 [Mycena albidolilacea]